MVFIIGMGPGSADYIVPAATQAIYKCDILFGADRFLRLFEDFSGEKKNFANILEQIAEYAAAESRRKNIGILVSGDPGFYSLLERLRKVLPKNQYRVIPGISSSQFAFARLGISWQESSLVSVHGKPLQSILAPVQSGKLVFVLTDSNNSPERIAEYLLAHGVSNRPACVCQNLSYADERVDITDLATLSKGVQVGLCAVIIFPQDYTA